MFTLNEVIQMVGGIINIRVDGVLYKHIQTSKKLSNAQKKAFALSNKGYLYRIRKIPQGYAVFAYKGK